MTNFLLHTVLIYGHALSGLIAFALGLIVLRPQSVKSALFSSYFYSLWVMIVLLVAVVLLDWPQLSLVSQISFGGLTLLALYTGFRGWQARQILYAQPSGWQSAYLDHVGFTLISLFDGFVIVGALDLNAAGWLVGLVAVLGVVVGISAINYFKGRFTQMKSVA